MARCSPVAWASTKLPRLCQGPTGAETQAMSIAEDKLWLVRLCWAELNGAVPQMNMSSLNSLASSVRGRAVTDSKGVYDAVLKKETSGLGVKEGRAGLEMLCLRLSIRQHNTTLKWVNTYANVSDALTKAEAKPVLDRFL